MKPTLLDAIHALGIDGGFKIKDNKIAKWYSDKKQPSDKAIQAKLSQLQDEFNLKSYERQRLSEYPELIDCIHALLDGGDTLTELQAKRAKVKAKYPKPT